jgi:hypothetical protein
VAKPKRNVVIALLVFLTLLVSLPFVGLILLAHALSGFDLKIGRKHLAPIPVAPAACPYLEPVREQSAALDDLWMRGLNGSVASDHFRDELDLRLIALQADAHAAEAHVPAPIVQKLRTMEWDIAVGRNELPHAQGPGPLLSDPQFPLFDGLNALADASDLVGPACGAPVYAGFAF